VLVLLERIYDIHHSDGLREHDIYIKFHKDRFRCSEVVRGEGDRHVCQYACLRVHMHKAM
jgi:hypothetical protein